MDLTKSYAETKGILPIDWNVFLSREDINETSWRTAQHASANWVTCACGAQCSIIPRVKIDGEPKDKTLWNLGVRFNFAIKDRDKFSAKSILAKIEERSAYLIKQINDGAPY